MGFVVRGKEPIGAGGARGPPSGRSVSPLLSGAAAGPCRQSPAAEAALPWGTGGLICVRSESVCCLPRSSERSRLGKGGPFSPLLVYGSGRRASFHVCRSILTLHRVVNQHTRGGLSSEWAHDSLSLNLGLRFCKAGWLTWRVLS